MQSRSSRRAALWCWPLGRQVNHWVQRMRTWPSQGRTLSKPRSRWSPCFETCTGRPCGNPARLSAQCSGQRPPAGGASSHTVAALQAAEQANPAHRASGRPSRAGPLTSDAQKVGIRMQLTALEWQNPVNAGAPSPEQAPAVSTSPVWPHRRSPGAGGVWCGVEGGVCHDAELGSRQAGGAEEAVAL